MTNKVTQSWQKFLRESKLAVKEKFAPDDFKDVYNTARMAHVGQSRRDGSEYFSHPSEVRNIARKFYPKDNVVQMAALLHDSLEDAPGSTVSSVEEMEEFIKGSIQDPAAGDEVIRVVRALTHEKGGDYQSYVIDLLGDVPTLRVKLADMVHNLTDNPSPKQKAKYASALNAIGQKTGGNAPQGISDNHWNTLMSLIEDRMSEEVWDKDDGEYQASVVKPVRMKEEEGLSEKAVSKAQQRYFGMLKKCKEEGDCPDKEMEKKAGEMTATQVDDFAGTKHKGLPGKKEELRNRIRETIARKLSENSCCNEEVLEEAEYQGKKVTLNDPIRTSGESKKFKVYVKNDKGNVVVVRFGDPDMEIRRDNPEARSNFRKRHDCANKKDRTTAGYWSCWQWRAGSKVDS